MSDKGFETTEDPALARMSKASAKVSSVSANASPTTSVNPGLAQGVARGGYSTGANTPFLAAGGGMMIERTDVPTISLTVYNEDGNIDMELRLDHPTEGQAEAIIDAFRSTRRMQ